MKVERVFVPRSTTYYPGVAGVEYTELDHYKLVITEPPIATFKNQTS